MQTVLFHPSRCEKVIEPILGKKALRYFESVLENEEVDKERVNPVRKDRTLTPALSIRS